MASTKTVELDPTISSNSLSELVQEFPDLNFTVKRNDGKCHLTATPGYIAALANTEISKVVMTVFLKDDQRRDYRMHDDGMGPSIIYFWQEHVTNCKRHPPLVLPDGEEVDPDDILYTDFNPLN